MLAANMFRSAAVAAVALVLLSGATGSLAQTIVSVHFLRANAENSTTVQPGDLIYVTMEGTPSTGFLWKIWSPLDATVLSLSGSSHTDVPPDNYVFNFSVVATEATKTQVYFGYSQAWNRDPTPALAAYLDVIVEP